ncbi:MAG: FtsX-like permease family protein [Chloroflexi bacterium]|nr:FtsX-like permease family protein [Chloroflexota bacterium]
MLLVARKNLFSERTRLAISVGGVALSVLLISLLLALYRGWDEKVGGFLEHSDIDVWIGSQGARDFITSASMLPLQGSEALDTLPSVKQWSPLIVRPMWAVKVEAPRPADFDEDAATKMNIHLIGYDPQIGIGGPIRIVEGKSAPGPGEIIVDEALAKRHGLRLGDMISAGGSDWKVAGKSSGGDFVASQVVFVDIDEARKVLKMEGLTTFLALRLQDDVDVPKFADDIEMLRPGVVAFTGEQFAANTRDRILGEVLPILTVVLLLAFVVGLAVAGLTIYTATVEKSREYGILKAVGFANRYLYRLVLEQSLVTGVLGFAIGVGLTLLIAPWARGLVPQFVVFIRWQDVLGVAGVTLLMVVLAAYVPVRRLAAIDPVAVFKA